MWKLGMHMMQPSIGTTSIFIDKLLIQGNYLGVDAKGYQLSHKRNKRTGIVRDKRNYRNGTNSQGQVAMAEIERGNKEP
jgi:hypothetical protein